MLLWVSSKGEGAGYDRCLPTPGAIYHCVKLQSDNGIAIHSSFPVYRARNYLAAIDYQLHKDRALKLDSKGKPVYVSTLGIQSKVAKYSHRILAPSFIVFIRNISTKFYSIVHLVPPSCAVSFGPLIIAIIQSKFRTHCKRYNLLLFCLKECCSRPCWLQSCYITVNTNAFKFKLS